MSNIASTVKTRLDSFVNLVTGLGSRSRDKTMRVHYHHDSVLQLQQLQDLYTNDFARRIVSLVVDEAMRQGFTLSLDGSEDPKRAEQLMRECEKFDLRGKVREVAIWGRLFGGAALWFVVERGLQKDPFKPDMVRAGSLRAIHVLERIDLTREGYYTDANDPKFGETAIFSVRRNAGNAGTIVADVHETRMVMFPGVLTHRIAKQANAYWDHSALQPVYDVLSSADMNWRAVCNLIVDYGQGVFKIKNLMDLVSAGNEDVVKKRIELIDMARSVVNSVILDATEEDFERKATPVAGVDALLMQTWQRLAAAAEMPVTKLVGMSPAGLNATGENDRASWYDVVQSFRDVVLTPRLNTGVQTVARNLGYTDAERWRVSWPSLYQLTAKEEAQVYLTRSQADALYVKSGVVHADEMAQARSGGTLRSTFPKLDLTRQRALPPSADLSSTPITTEKTEPPALP